MKKLNKKNSKRILLGLGVLLLIIIITNIVKSSCNIIEEMYSRPGEGTPKIVKNGVGKAGYTTNFNAVKSPKFSAVDDLKNKGNTDQIKGESDKQLDNLKKYGKNVSISKISNQGKDQGKDLIPGRINGESNQESNNPDGINGDSIVDKSKSVDNSKNLNDKSKEKNQIEIGFFVSGPKDLKITGYNQQDEKDKKDKK